MTVLAEDAYQDALAGAAGTCLVLTNTRSLGEPAAAELTARAARGLMAVARRRGARIQLVSRSDSTLRGHVMAEVAALQAARREAAGGGFDGVLLAPAFLEAGRLTAADIHWARVGPGLVPVGETEFARDPAFGYTASDLRDFVTEKSGGAIGRDDVAAISLADIRLGGPSRVRELLAGVRGGTWVVVNATEYSDLDTVAWGVLLAERAGRSFLFRSGPSFVRALSGLGPRAPLRGEEIRPAGPRGGHGRSWSDPVDQTSKRLAALRARRHHRHRTRRPLGRERRQRRGGGHRAAESCARWAPLGSSSPPTRAARSLPGRDRRTAWPSRAASPPLWPARCAALAAKPAWVIAKGRITSHDVAVRGLGIRRAGVDRPVVPRPGLVFRPIDAWRPGGGVPFVVFTPNSVGDDGNARAGCGDPQWRRAGGLLMQVGWIGLGAMGAPMAARLARCGHSVHGYDVVADRTAALAADGVQGVATIAAAVGGADVVVIMVATPDQVEQVLFAPGGAAGALTTGAVVMIMATAGPEAVVSAAQRLAASGFLSMTRPVSGACSQTRTDL